MASVDRLGGREEGVGALLFEPYTPPPLLLDPEGERESVGGWEGVMEVVVEVEGEGDTVGEAMVGM